MISKDFEEHIIFEKIEQFTSRIEESELKENLDLESYSFLESSIQYIEDRLKITIPILINKKELDSLSELIGTSLEHINYFISNSSNAHITNANNNLFSALNVVKNIPLPFSKNDFNFSKAISNFKNAVQEKYESLEQEKISLENEVLEVKTDLENNQEELERVSELLKEKEEKIVELTEEFEEKYEKITNEFQDIYNSNKEEYREEINELQSDFRKEVDDLKEKINIDTTDLVNKLEKKLIDAKKIVNIVGNVGVTGNFQNIANEHKATANNWRLVAIIFMSLLSGLLVFTIWDISNGVNFDWVKSLIRIIAAAALSYPATYAAKESSRHRELESFNRRNELELASIEPFIELLPEEKKQEIKENLVKKYFGNNIIREKLNESKDEISVGGFEKIIKAIIPILNK
jgi:hypothetical protein